jgi:DNA-binding response OmpR family regulator
MSDTTAGLLQVGLLIAALAACYRPLGAYMARVYESEHDLRAERVIYRVMGVDSKADQRWPVYARALLAFSAVSVLFLYGLQRFQSHLPLSLGFPGVAPAQAWNTAASFVTNTNWQSYSGESTMGHLVQMAGLAVQNFASAAVGMAVAVALIRGFTRNRTDRIGNFWVDLVRGCVRILLPIAVVGTILLLAMGAVQNFSSGTDATTLASTASRSSAVCAAAPIVVLSGRTDSADKVDALVAGADDYVTKPFGVDELMARMRAVSRRATPADVTPTVTFGQTTVDLAARRVTVRDADHVVDVRLTPTEWHLVEVLLRHPGKLLSQRQLLTEVWGPGYDTASGNLRVYMAQLRRKLEADPARPRHLLTEPGMGYRFQPDESHDVATP